MTITQRNITRLLRRLLSRSLTVLPVLFILTALQGCFTGVESTPRISDRDLKGAVAASRRESGFLAGITGEAPARWQKGKQWVVTDRRSDRSIGRSLDGDTITLESIIQSTSILGMTEAVITFATPDGPAAYNTGITPDSLIRRSSLAIPYLVETAVIDSLRTRLNGKTFYVMSSLWGDMEGGSLRGLRFIPVKVESVDAGRGIEPVRITLSYSVNDKMRSTPGAMRNDMPGQRFFTLPMALPGDEPGGTTRSFDNLFSLSDPRRRYPKISDDAWLAITESRVIEGMTRDECRLAIGAPADIDRRAGYSSLQEIWSYPDGRSLVFIDGLLTRAY